MFSKSLSAGRAGQVVDWFLPAAAATMAIVVVLFSGRLGVQQFDMGNFADGAWRIYVGQFPYRDFSMPQMPLVFYLQAFFFRLFGNFQWMALFWHAAIVNAIAAILTYSLASQRVGRWAALGCAVLSAVTFSAPLSFPYHDQIAFLFVLMALWLVELDTSLNCRRRVVLDAIVGVSLASALFSKPNIGLAAAVGVGCVVAADSIWTHHSRRKAVERLVPVVTSFLLASLAAMAYFQLHAPFLEHMLLAARLSSRLGRLLSIGWWMGQYGSFVHSVHSISFFVLAGASMGILVDARRLWLHRATIGPLLTRIVVIASLSVLAALTGQLHFSIYQELLGVLVCYLLYLFRTLNRNDIYEQPVGVGLLRWMSKHGNKLATGFLGIFVVGLFRQSATSERMVLGRYSMSYALLLSFLLATSFGFLLLRRAEIRKWLESLLTRHARKIGALILMGLALVFLDYDVTRFAWSYWPEEVHTTGLVLARDGPFAGVYVDPDVLASINDVVNYSNKYISRDDVVFIYPNTRFLYGIIGRTPISGILLYFQPGLTHADKDHETAAVLRGDPKWMIIQRTDPKNAFDVIRTESPHLAEWAEEKFEVATVLSAHIVLRRKASK